MTDTKTVIITGAGSGIGRACAYRFADGGFRVALCDINEKSVRETEDDLRGAGKECLSAVADVTSSEDLKRVVQLTVQTWGRIDSLVANAGIQNGGGLLQTEAEDWQAVIEINLKGVARCCKAVLPTMQEQKSGSIVIVSSINAIVGSKQMAAYDMSKAGVLGLMRNLAVEFGSDGIRANAICPGNTITDFHINKLAPRGMTVDDIRSAMSDYGALGRAAEPQEIANAIYFLASDDASFITGHTLVADGGHSIRARD